MFEQSIQVATFMKRSIVYQVCESDLPLLSAQGKRKRLGNHLHTYHVLENYYVASGAKQMKVVMALHTSDQLNGAIGRLGLNSDVHRACANNGGSLSF